MSCIGLIDESGVNIEWEDVAKGKGDFSDPFPILMSLCSNREPYCDFSVTELINDPYRVQMDRRFDYFESPDDMQDRILGSAIHCLIEKAVDPDDCLIEHRMVAKIKIGKKLWKIGGTCDLIMGTEMWDYKTITMGKLRMMKKKKEISDAYQQQLNAYRWLYEQDSGELVDTLCIRVIVRDWRFYEFRKARFDAKQYPRGGILDIDVWPLTKTKKWLVDRLKRHVAAERFSDDNLFKAGECDTWGGTRCNSYCPVNDICHFRMNDKKVAPHKP